MLLLILLKEVMGKGERFLLLLIGDGINSSVSCCSCSGCSILVYTFILDVRCVEARVGDILDLVTRTREGHVTGQAISNLESRAVSRH